MHTNPWAVAVVAIGMAGGLVAGLPERGDAADVSSPGLSKTEYTQLCEQLHIKNQPWTSIPWKVSLTEARQLAAKYQKPIFLVVNTGNCLGWT